LNGDGGGAAILAESRGCSERRDRQRNEHESPTDSRTCHLGGIQKRYVIPPP
jgi:hypothetical protein